MMNTDRQRRGRDDVATSDDGAVSETNWVRDVAKRATLDALSRFDALDGRGDDEASARGDAAVRGDARGSPPQVDEGSTESGGVVSRPGLTAGLALVGIATVVVVVRRRRDSSGDDADGHDDSDDSGGHGGFDDSDDGGRSATVQVGSGETEFDAIADAATGADSSGGGGTDVEMADESGYGSMTEGTGQEYESAEDVPAPEEQPDSERRGEG